MNYEEEEELSRLRELAQDIADLDPYCAEDYCFGCGNNPGDPHDEDCSWANARRWAEGL